MNADVARRIVDVLIGVTGLMLLSPVMVAVAIAVKLDSTGPILFGGWRAGRYGKPFRMWKFRTMAVNRKCPGPAVTMAGDPRVTRAGRWLRATKLDEIPQMLNLVTGEMTVVGPRPEAPEIVARYTPAQMAVLNVKPGITGPSQISSQNEAETIPGDAAEDFYVHYILDSKVRLDVDYIERRTLRSDVAVVARTGMLVLRAIASSVRGQA